MEKNTEVDAMTFSEFRRNYSIGFFNGSNAAVEMLKLYPPATVEEAKKFIIETRDWFVDEHEKYFLSRVAVIGSQGISPEVVKGLDKAKQIYANSQSAAGK